jgi:hypothetical protein
MRKLLNAVGILILSMSVLSCSKDEEPVVPITKDKIVKEWIIQENPEIDISIVGASEKATEVKSQLEKLFQKGDRYLFNDDSSCSITRGNSKAGPDNYKVEGAYLIFDGYIKFLTNESGNRLTLTAGKEEIREIVREKVKDEYEGEALDIVLSAVKGSIKLVLQQVEEE